MSDLASIIIIFKIITFFPPTANQDDSNDLKAKNIHQTELVSDLREGIQQIGRHFQAIDPKNAKIVSKLISLPA